MIFIPNIRQLMIDIQKLGAYRHEKNHRKNPAEPAYKTESHFNSYRFLLNKTQTNDFFHRSSVF